MDVCHLSKENGVVNRVSGRNGNNGGKYQLSIKTGIAPRRVEHCPPDSWRTIPLHKIIDKSGEAWVTLEVRTKNPPLKDLTRTFVLNLAVQNHVLLLCEGWGMRMVEGWMTKLSLAHAKRWANSKRDAEDTVGWLCSLACVLPLLHNVRDCLS